MLLLFVFLLEKPQGKQEQRKTASETCECDLNLVFRRAGKVSQVDICMKEPGVGFTGGSHQGFEQLSESGRPLPLLLWVDGNWGGGGGTVPILCCPRGCVGTLSLLASLPAPAAPRAGERAAGWRWCAAVCKTGMRGLGCLMMAR